jgi:hypothetical protein
MKREKMIKNLKSPDYDEQDSDKEQEEKPKEKYKQHKQNFLKHIEPLKD